MLYLKSFLYARDATMSLSNRASPVELIAELVQVVLEIARRYVMVDIQQKPLTLLPSPAVRRYSPLSATIMLSSIISNIISNRSCNPFSRSECLHIISEICSFVNSMVNKF